MLSAAPSWAQQKLGIAAVVNDEIISLFDLQNRLRLVVAMAGQRADAKAERRLMPQVLRNLITEALHNQEAKRLSVETSDADLRQAMLRLESQNQLPAGGLDDYLKQRGIDKAELEKQLRSTLTWVKVVNKLARSQIQITKEEIDEEINRTRREKGRPQFLISEIFIAVDDPGKESEAKTLVERLAQQVRQGAQFTDLARAFSQSASAAVGGSLGWVSAGQLAAEVDQVLMKMAKNSLSLPIRTLSGYTILLVHDRRKAPGLKLTDETVSLFQLFASLTKGAGAAEISRQSSMLRSFAQGVKDCKGMADAGRKIGSSLSGPLGSVNVDNLPENLRGVVRSLPENKPSDPIQISGGVAILMVCERQVEQLEQRVRNGIQATLLNARLSIHAKRIERDIKRAAFVDIRL